jgi:hypothetical protein
MVKIIFSKKIIIFAIQSEKKALEYHGYGIKK